MKNKNTMWMALATASIAFLLYFTKGLFESFIFFIGVLLGMVYMEIMITGRMFNKKSDVKVIIKGGQTSQSHGKEKKK